MINKPVFYSPSLKVVGFHLQTEFMKITSGKPILYPISPKIPTNLLNAYSSKSILHLYEI